MDKVADDIVNLSGLTNVTTLRIDLHVVSLTKYSLTLEVPTASLPLNLHTLHLSSVPLPKFDRALRQFSDGEGLVYGEYPRSCFKTSVTQSHYSL